MNNKEIWCDFLWIDDVRKEDPNIEIYPFCRVIFGMNCSPFLLNAMLRHHGTEYYESDLASAEYILSGLYVDDLTTGGEDDDEPYKTRQWILASQPDGSPCVNEHQTKNSHWEDLKWSKGKWASWETRISSRRRSVLCKDHRRWSWRNRPHKGAQGPWNLLEPGIRHWCYEAEWDRRICQEPGTYKEKHSSNCS